MIAMSARRAMIRDMQPKLTPGSRSTRSMNGHFSLEFAFSFEGVTRLW